MYNAKQVNEKGNTFLILQKVCLKKKNRKTPINVDTHLVAIDLLGFWFLTLY